MCVLKRQLPLVMHPRAPLQLWLFLRLSLIFNLTIRRNPGQELSRMTCYWDLSGVSLIIELQWSSLERKISKVNFHFHCRSTVPAIRTAPLFGADLAHLAEGPFARFLHFYAPFSLSFHPPVLEGQQEVQATLQEWGIWLYSLKAKNLCKLFEILLHQKQCLLTHLSLSSVIYIISAQLMDLYHIPCAVLRYSFMCL